MIKLDAGFFRITCKICNARSVVMRSDNIRLRTPSFSDLNSTLIIVTLICLHESGWICYRYCTVCIHKTWFRRGNKCFDFWKLQRGNPCIWRTSVSLDFKCASLTAMAVKRRAWHRSTDSFSVLLFLKCDWYVVVRWYKLKHRVYLFAIQLFKCS